MKPGLARSLLCAAVALHCAAPSAGERKGEGARIVSVGGALTEIVYALGAESQLVAVDTTSLHPEAATALPKVGYMRQLSAEGVLSMQPTVVLATTEAGPPNVIAQLRAAGVALRLANADHGIDELKRKVRMVAEATQRAERGKALEARIDSELAAARAYVAAQTARPRVLFLLSHSGSPQVAGQGTAADALIELAGGVNVMQGFSGYKPLTAEAAVAAAPQVILLTRQGLDAVGGTERLLALPGLALTPAGKAKKVVALDALYLLGFGPRLPGAVREVAERIR